MGLVLNLKIMGTEAHLKETKYSHSAWQSVHYSRRKDSETHSKNITLESNVNIASWLETSTGRLCDFLPSDRINVAFFRTR